MSSDGEMSDDPNTVIIPVEDEKSDGDRTTWPANDQGSRFVYSLRDDEGWRIGLAQMWVEKQMGAPEDGMWRQVFFFLCFLSTIMSGSLSGLKRSGHGAAGLYYGSVPEKNMTLACSSSIGH